MEFTEWLLNEEKKKKFVPEILTPAQKASRQRKKNNGVATLAKNMSRLQKRVSSDLSSSDEEIKLTAAAVKTMLDTSERVGNKASAKSGHHGVTGLKRNHIKKGGGSIKLKYTGKSGMKHEKELKDKRVLKAMEAGTDNNLFKTQAGKEVTNTMVNSYLKEFGITSKDIRGYNANKFMSQKLSGLGGGDEKERKDKFLRALEEIAEKVGHTPSMLRNSYLNPSMEDDYVKRGVVKKRH